MDDVFLLGRKVGELATRARGGKAGRSNLELFGPEQWWPLGWWFCKNEGDAIARRGKMWTKQRLLRIDDRFRCEHQCPSSETSL